MSRDKKPQEGRTYAKKRRDRPVMHSPFAPYNPQSAQFYKKILKHTSPGD